MENRNVIIALSKNKLNNQDKYLIEKHIKENVQWDFFVGQLLLHKISCRAYKHLIEHDLICLVPPVIKRFLCENFELSRYKNAFKKEELKIIANTLNAKEVDYCIIKGLSIEEDLFSESIREMNDIDILISIQNFEKVHNILEDMGYKRGKYNPISNQILADRQSDLFFIMNTHQTSPYYKMLYKKLLKVSTVDLQFELVLQKKFKYDISTEVMLKNRISKNTDGQKYYMVNQFDNFLLMCTHLYGEAVLIDEIRNCKDLQLTKFSDIYEWLEKYYGIFNWMEKLDYIKEKGFLKPILYCLYIVAILYKSARAEEIYNKAGKQSIDFLDEYYDEMFEIKKWKLPIIERIFTVNKLGIME